MTAGQCSAAMTVQLQDGNGNAIAGSKNTSGVNITLSFDNNVISATQYPPLAYSQSGCPASSALMPNAQSPEGKPGAAGHRGTGIIEIMPGTNSVNVYMIPSTSIAMGLLAVDQASNYAIGSQTETVLPAAAASVIIAGPDTLGLNVCSHAFYARALDAFNNPANVSSAVNLQINASDLGSAKIYSDSGCTTPINNQITLNHSTTPPIWGSNGGPDSDVPFYLMDSKSENISVVASVQGNVLPFSYGVEMWTTSLANPGQPPIPPQTTINPNDLSWPASVSCGCNYPTSCAITCVPDSGNPSTNGTNLQSAINAASPGEVIVLTSGVTYQNSLRLPQGISNNPNGEYVTITSSDLNKLPPKGTRVPASNAHMATIMANTGNPDFAILAQPGNLSQGILPTSYFKFVGVEITIDPTVTLQYAIMNLDGATPKYNPTQIGELANHMFVLSSWVHGNPIANVQHGIGLGGVYEAVVDSTVSDCHFIGADAQAIGGRSGMTLLIQNNTLEGSGENVLFGGAPAFYPNSITTDLEIIGNTFDKPLSWYDSPQNSQFVCVQQKSGGCGHWEAKNLLELKEGRRILVSGNTFANSWVDGQTGFALLITPRGNGVDYFVIVEDVSYQNNYITHTNNGLAFTDQDSIAPAHSEITRSVAFENNAGWDIGDAFWGGKANMLLLSPGFDGLTVSNNTFGFSVTNNFWETGPNLQIPPQNVTITNNVVSCGKYGFHSGPGWSAFVNLNVSNNALIGCTAKELPPQATGNYMPTDPSAMGFTKWNADSPTNDSDILSLGSGSQYSKDGLGVNWSALPQYNP